MRILALLGICLLMAGLAFAQLPTTGTNQVEPPKGNYPTMSEAERNFKGGMSPTPMPTPPPPGWQTANPTVSGPPQGTKK